MIADATEDEDDDSISSVGIQFQREIRLLNLEGKKSYRSER